ncbi:hypothetical protein Tco_1089155 [Tanacetum coccineum]
MNDCDDLQQHTTSSFKADHVEAFDLDCDDEATASAIFMASLSPAETKYIEHLVSNNDSYDELMSDRNFIFHADYKVNIKNDAAQYVPPPEQDNTRILSVIKQIKCQLEQCNTANQETKSVNESLTSELK